MHGIISLLPPPYSEQVRAIWKELEDECGLRGVKVTPIPHFSWQIAQEYDLERLQQILSEFAATAHPIQIYTGGLGLFTGPRPIIFIPIIKTTSLIDFHARLWERTQAASQSASPFYSPPAWVPHITLAYEDVDRANISAVMGRLVFRSFSWEMTIDNLTLIYELNGQVEPLQFKYQFS
ncbi:MAG TPA: 2'-5' RNA ligase family protein [Anaerolineales bacterium]